MKIEPGAICEYTASRLCGMYKDKLVEVTYYCGCGKYSTSTGWIKPYGTFTDSHIMLRLDLRGMSYPDRRAHINKDYICLACVHISEIEISTERITPEQFLSDILGEE